MLNIIGGTYYEICNYPEWDELFGSGFRSAIALTNRNIPVVFHTYADEKTSAILTILTSHLSIKIVTQHIHQNIQFFYEHPLASPIFYPSLKTFYDQKTIIVSEASNTICFGMLEGNAIISSNKVVFDPQNPEAPKSFWTNGSFASELIIVLNYKEAKKLAKATDWNTITDFFTIKENAKAVIVKNGAEGLYLLEKGTEAVYIPSFVTDKVWPIGTGDIFTSNFGYEWMVKNEPLSSAAYNASLSTAFYANSKILPIPIKINPLKEFKRKNNIKKTVYLAGPFFTMSQRWLINQFRNALLQNFNVFSPFHDVGLGTAKDVVHLDIKAISDCDIMVAVIDGLDSGTLFEIGYAKAIGKNVIAFVENEGAGNLTMLEGTNCKIENDFSTLIYKTIWEAYS